MYAINIKVNGEDVKLTEFPAKIITDVILAMLKSLHGVEDIEHATIDVESIIGD